MYRKRSTGDNKLNLDFGCMPETKPSYCIVLMSSPVIAGLIQVEIIVIISPTEVGDAGLLMSKPLCAEVSESRLVNCGKLRAGNHTLLSSVSHLTTTLFPPSLLP